MPVSDYTLVIDTNWITGWGIPARNSTGFTFSFNTAPPGGAQIHYVAWGGTLPRKLIEGIATVPPDDLTPLVVMFAAELVDQTGVRTRELILIDMEEIRAAMLRIIRQERLDAVDLGGRSEQYTTTSLKQLQDLLKDLQLELDNLVVHRRMIFRTSYSRGL